MVYRVMISFMQKTLAQINDAVQEGEAVIVTAAPAPQPPDVKAPENVDVVTTATFAKNPYFPCMPVQVPPPQVKK